MLIYPVCGKSFLNGRSLAKHSIYHEDSTIYTCKECDKTFAGLRKLKDHQRCHKPISCKLCPYEGSVGNLQRHKKSVHSVQKFACAKCGKELSSIETLKTHEQHVVMQKKLRLEIVLVYIEERFSTNCSICKDT